MAGPDGGGFPPGLPGVTDYGNKTNTGLAPWSLCWSHSPGLLLQARVCLCSITISAHSANDLIKDKDFG
jgi:hypothetical protein